MDLPDPDLKEMRWWNSFALAKALGLAAEIDLGSQAPDNIEVLYAVGLGNERPDAAPVAAELRNRLMRLLDAADLLRQALATAATDGARQDALWTA